MTAGSDTNGRLGDIIASLRGAARSRRARNADHGTRPPAPAVATLPPVAEPATVPAEEMTDWPTWRNPR